MRRVIIFFIFVGLFALSFQIGAMSEVDPEEAEEFLKEFKDLVEDIDGIEIFVHNLSISLPMFIPGFGVGWGLFSAWSTGYAFASIATLLPAISEISPLTILFLSPFGLMEIVAYSIGTSRSYMLIWMVIKKCPINKRVLKITGIEIGIMVGLLLAGGFLEFYMIELIEEGGFEMPGF